MGKQVPIGERQRQQIEAVVVHRWRLEQLLGLGFDRRSARALAGSRTDLSDARRLIAAGCPPNTAARILL